MTGWLAGCGLLFLIAIGALVWALWRETRRGK